MYFINDGTNKLTTNRKDLYDGIKYNQMFSIGEVVSVTDPNGMGRIKVRIYGPASRGGDDDTQGLINQDGVLNTDVLPWAMPMTPKFMFSQPKVGEAVYVFAFDNTKPFIDRLYFGPIISQEPNLTNEPYKFSALGGLSISNKAPSVNVDTIPELRGVFPNPQDVSIQGRNNTDITQKNNEVVIRAGKFVASTPNEVNPFSFKFNTKTQGYIQIKNNVIISERNAEEVERGTVTNIVSSKINLLTHKNGSPIFNLSNPENLISDEELAVILEGAHQLPFGDILLKYLRLMKNAIFSHVHNGNGNPATDLTASGNIQGIADFKAQADDLEKAMLSKNIRIN